MLNKEIVAQVIGDLRAMQIDDRISERYVLSKLKDYNSLFLKRENEQLRLYSDNNVWFSVTCLQMEPLDYTKCNDVTVNKEIPYMRSTEPIPEIYSSAIGPLIREVTTLDGSKIFRYTSPSEYKAISKRKYKDKSTAYFWFDGNRHLILPDVSFEIISITAAFRDPFRAKLIDDCKQESCINPMEDPFLCPGHLLSTVRGETVKDLFSYYKRVIEDEVADLDSNTKTQKPRNAG